MKWIYIFTVLVLFFFSEKKTTAQSGTLDPLFGINGRFTQHLNFNNELAKDIAINNDGKILMLDGNYLLRFLTDGNPDTSFGDQGKVSLDLYQEVTDNSLAVDYSNRIVVVAEDNSYGEHGVRLYRYFPDGSSDTSFNWMDILVGGDADNSILIQQDGKIVLATNTQGYSSVTSVYRWNENGLPDSTFTTVELNSEFFSFPLGITEQDDNKLLITGTSDSNLFVTRIFSDGTLDSSFGVNGTVLIDNGGNEVGQDIAEANDGKIYITGYSETTTGSSFNCWRLLSNGNADSSFGTNGLVTLHTGTQHNWGYFVFANEDSTVIVGGSIYNGATNNPVLYKLLNNGSIDLNFGSNGVAGKTFTCSKSIELNAVKTADGNILLCGTKSESGNNLPAISKFNSAGINDSAFGVNGTASSTINDSEFVWQLFHDFAILPDGRILGGGEANEATLFRFSQDGVQDFSYGENGFLVPGSQSQRGYIRAAFNDNSTYLIETFQHLIYGYQSFNIIDGLEGAWDFAIHKFAADGSPDSSYGVNGVLSPEEPGLTNCEYGLVTQDSKLLIGGHTNENYEQYFLLQLNSDGSRDSSFANNGLLTSNFLSLASGSFAVIDPTGKIVIEDSHFVTAYETEVEIQRFLPNGTPDFSFGNNGMIIISNTWLAVEAIATTPSNEIVALIYNSLVHKNEILKLKENGTIDSSFGTNGYKNLDAISISANPTLIVQADGKILCVGYPFKLLRWRSDGTVDSTFGTNGIATFDTLPGSSDRLAMHLQSDGKILVSGLADHGYYMARILNDVQTGIENYPDENNLKVFPNPCTNLLTLMLPSSEENEMTIKISDVTGKTILTQRISQQGDRLKLNVSVLPSGIYFLTLASIDQSTAVKFVKQ